MVIQNDSKGRKWIHASTNKFLVGNLKGKDSEKLVAASVLIPEWVSSDEWSEIDETEMQRIKAAKAKTGEIEYPKEITQALGLMRMKINDIELTDEQSLEVQDLYPNWTDMIGKSLSTGMRVQYNGKLYKVKQDVPTVLENQPPSVDTAALYEEINATNKGTKDDPIPYNNNMELFNGKYYSQGGVVYKCTRDSGQAVYNPLSELVGLYVEKVTEDLSL